MCGIDVFDLAGLVIVRLALPFVLHFVKFLESFGQSMDSWSSLVARENRCIFLVRLGFLVMSFLFLSCWAAG